MNEKDKALLVFHRDIGVEKEAAKALREIINGADKSVRDVLKANGAFVVVEYGIRLENTVDEETKTYGPVKSIIPGEVSIFTRDVAKGYERDKQSTEVGASVPYSQIRNQDACAALIEGMTMKMIQALGNALIDRATTDGAKMVDLYNAKGSSDAIH